MHGSKTRRSSSWWMVTKLERHKLMDRSNLMSTCLPREKRTRNAIGFLAAKNTGTSSLKLRRRQTAWTPQKLVTCPLSKTKEEHPFVKNKNGMASNLLLLWSHTLSILWISKRRSINNNHQHKLTVCYSFNRQSLAPTLTNCFITKNCHSSTVPWFAYKKSYFARRWKRTYRSLEPRSGK